MIHFQPVKAIELYREGLRLTSEYAVEGIRSDYLPKIHTMYNLHLILGSLPEGTVEPTPRDSELITEVRSSCQKDQVVQIYLLVMYQFRSAPDFQSQQVS